jgi:hypothetical protein
VPVACSSVARLVYSQEVGTACNTDRGRIRQTYGTDTAPYTDGICRISRIPNWEESARGEHARAFTRCKRVAISFEGRGASRPRPSSRKFESSIDTTTAAAQLEFEFPLKHVQLVYVHVFPFEFANL